MWTLRPDGVFVLRVDEESLVEVLLEGEEGRGWSSTISIDLPGGKVSAGLDKDYIPRDTPVMQAKVMAWKHWVIWLGVLKDTLLREWADSSCALDRFLNPPPLTGEHWRD